MPYGEGFLYVLDLDIKKGQNGRENFDTLRDSETLPDCPQVITSSGGEHYYLISKILLHNSQSKIAQGIDIRGKGGYVAGAGSIRDGNTYEWELSSALDCTKPVHCTWLEQIILNATSKSISTEGTLGFEHEDSEDLRFVLPEVLPIGQQNDLLFRYARSLFAQKHPKNEVFVLVWEVMNDQRRCPQDSKEPWTPKHLHQIIGQAYKYYVDQLVQNTPAYIKDLHNTVEEPASLANSVNPTPATQNVAIGADTGAQTAIEASNLPATGSNRYTLSKTSEFSERLMSDLFVEKVGWEYLFHRASKSWMHYDGKIWTHNEDKILIHFTDMVNYYLERSTTKKERNMLTTYLGYAKTRATLELVKPRKKVSAEELDTQNHLLNLQNGTYNFKTRALERHRPQDLLTKIAGVSFDAKANCPNWLDFLDVIFKHDQDLIKYVQKIIGYCLTGYVDEQIFVVLYGKGANGKSTFINTIAALLGDYHKATPASTLLKRKFDGTTANNDIARLQGARLAYAVETIKNNSLDDQIIKTITSTEPITARCLYKEYFEFTATFKTILATNYKPTIAGSDYGIWRRVKMLPFVHQFMDDEKIPQFEKKYLFPELPGILNWAIEGYYLLKNEGFNEPKSVTTAIADYQTEQDLVQQFIDDCLIFEEEAFISSKELLHEYKNWCLSNNVQQDSRTFFYQELKQKGIEPQQQTKKMPNGDRIRGFLGIRCSETRHIYKDVARANYDREVIY